MYRALFVLFSCVALVGLGSCVWNFSGALRTWRRKRALNGLGRLTARHRTIQQGGLTYIAFLLNLIAGAVFAFSDPGNAPRSATGWILYGVLWSILLTVVGLSWNQRTTDTKIRTYPLEAWDGKTERRKNATS